jgi:hypothetical protein
MQRWGFSGNGDLTVTVQEEAGKNLMVYEVNSSSRDEHITQVLGVCAVRPVPQTQMSMFASSNIETL